MAEQPKSTRAPKKLNAEATTKPAPTVKVTEKSIKAPPAIHISPEAPPSEPVIKHAPKAPTTVKAPPKSIEPTATAATHPAPSIEKTQMLRRTDKTTVSKVLERTTPTSNLIAKPTRSSRKPSLPPIELVSNSHQAKPMPPLNPPPPSIKFASRITPDNPALERTPANSSNRQAAAAPSTIAAASRPRPPMATTPTPVAPRSSDPLSAFQQDTRRAADDIRRGARNLGDWATRAGSSVGTEMQRGLENANQTINSWIGTCTNCQSSRPVERRDRWSRTSQGPASR
jgi:hypothetical protein